MLFVTGGTGLIGAHLLCRLVSSGQKVRALKRETSNLQQVEKVFSYYSENAEELFQQIEWVDGDILDYFGLEKLLCGVSEVFHCAAIVSFNSGERDQMIRNNVEGTANLVNAALENNVKKYCHVSSVAALGNAENGFSIDEQTNWVPSKKNSGYSESKFYSETEVWRGIEEGLDAVIVNPSIVLGPGNWDSGSAQLFKTVWNGMKFYTKGVTGYVDVKDVARAMILLMNDSNFEACKNNRFLLNAENLSYQQLFSQIADAFGKTHPKFYASPVLLALVWRAAAFWGKVSGKSAAITRETASASASIKNFDGSKITRCFDFNYTPVSQSIQQTAHFFLNDLPEK
jgi:nucleoside-diphosphate-sugar epimerase